jgi:hypothetical protein
MDRRRVLAVCAGALGAGCGYALQGRGITTDPSVKRIGVPLFRDRTGRLGLDDLVTGAVISELQKRGRFTVVREATEVDAVVEGEILSLDIQPVGYSNTETNDHQLASRYSATISAKVVYRKLGQAEPLWANDAYSNRDEYDVGDQGATYFDRESQSLERLAEQFARSLVATMLEAF